jgi:lathosterol oxidase
MAHFVASHLLVQITVFLSMLPARWFFSWAVSSKLQGAVASQPLPLQFVEILLVADLAEYWSHRILHLVPFLWRFHAIHHSSRHMDWLAASRIHIGDAIFIRAITFLPLFLLGFSNQAIFAYLLFVTFHALFIHANVGFSFGWLDWVIATPRFHHWHHAAEAEAVDKNFAVHIPAWDMLFGTCFLPRDRERWPANYGIAGNPVPENYGRQLLYPFWRKRRR